MWPVIMAAVRVYAPYIVLPFSIAVGSLGYFAERNLRNPDKAKQQAPSTLEQRGERQLDEKLKDPLTVSSLKVKKESQRIFLEEMIRQRNDDLDYVYLLMFVCLENWFKKLVHRTESARKNLIDHNALCFGGVIVCFILLSFLMGPL